MAVQATLVHLIWGRSLHASTERRVLVMGMNAPGMVTDWVLLRRSVAVLAAVLAAFVFSGPLHLEPATIALAGAAVLMLLDNLQHRDSRQADHVHATFAEIEWATIFFFIGLVRGGARGRGERLSRTARGRQGGGADGRQSVVAATIILWVSAILSAVIDNIPFVATMIPLIKGMAPAYGGPTRSSLCGGRSRLAPASAATARSSAPSANLAVAGIAERNGIRFGFVRYLIYGAPMTLVSIAICQIYVWLRYF